MTMASSTDETGGDGERHQRQIADAVAAGPMMQLVATSDSGTATVEYRRGPLRKNRKTTSTTKTTLNDEACARPVRPTRGADWIFRAIFRGATFRRRSPAKIERRELGDEPLAHALR